MQPRMQNPATFLPGAMPAIVSLAEAVKNGPVPAATLDLIHLRTSQINGCVACLDAGTRQAQRAGESDDRLAAVSGWRKAPHFTDAERAALGLAEAVTRLDDRSDPVADDVWAEAARHYDEPALAALVVSIATTNLFNRLNVSTRQLPGEW